jgi:hypothetical protein
MQRDPERIEPEFQPDPQLRLSEGRASGLQITIVALACTFILGLMIYGLNQPVTERIIASAPQAQTTGVAPTEPQQANPDAGGASKR